MSTDIFDDWDPDWQMMDQLIEDIVTDDPPVRWHNRLQKLWKDEDWDAVKQLLLLKYDFELEP